MKYLKSINESNVINIQNVYVIHNGSDIELDLYLTKKQADDECDRKNKEWSSQYKQNILIYSVMNLYDAIDTIKSYIRDEYNSFGDESY